MLVQRNYSDEKRIASYTITGVTRADMYKMTQVHDRVMDIISNHLDKTAKREYLNDDDLYDIVSILDVLIEDNRLCIRQSAFDVRKEKFLKMHKELKELWEEPKPSVPVPEEVLRQKEVDEGLLATF